MKNLCGLVCPLHPIITSLPLTVHRNDHLIVAMISTLSKSDYTGLLKILYNHTTDERANERERERESNAITPNATSNLIIRGSTRSMANSVNGLGRWL